MSTLRVNNPAKNHPLYQCAEEAEKLVKQGCLVFQKWTCGKCGDRVTANEPNHFTTEGHHEAREDGSPCGYITDMRITGCNYMVQASNPRAIEAVLKRMERK